MFFLSAICSTVQYMFNGLVPAMSLNCRSSQVFLGVHQKIRRKNVFNIDNDHIPKLVRSLNWNYYWGAVMCTDDLGRAAHSPQFPAVFTTTFLWSQVINELRYGRWAEFTWIWDDLGEFIQPRGRSHGEEMILSWWNNWIREAIFSPGDTVPDKCWKIWF